MSIVGYTAELDSFEIDYRTLDLGIPDPFLIGNVFANDVNLAGTILQVTSFTDALGAPITSISISASGDVRIIEPSAFSYLREGQVLDIKIKYTVRDNEYRTFETVSNLNIKITGVNDAPTAVLDSYDYTPGLSRAMAVLDNDFDPDADVIMTIVALESADGSITDTTPDDGLSITLTAGTISLNSDGSLKFQPAAGFNSASSFQYTIEDSEGDKSTATVNLISLVALVASNDSFITNEDTVLIINPLWNDTGSSITKIVITSLPANAGLQLNGAAVTLNQEISVADINANKLSFNPALNFNGINSFQYEVSDGTSFSTPATVSVTVNAVNDAPVAADDNLTVDEGKTISGNLLTNDSDVDFGDTKEVIGFYQINSPSSNYSLPIKHFGILDVSSQGNYSFSANGSGSIFLRQGQEITETLSYTIKDGKGAMSTANITITITGVNNAPTAKDDSADVNEDSTPLVINLLSNDKDPDTGDVLHISGISKSSTDNFVTTPIADDYGTLTLNVDGTVSFQADGSASQALAAGATATDSFTYQIKDEGGLSATATLTLTITGVNDLPIARNDAYSYNNTAGSVLTVDADDGVLKHRDAGETVDDSDVDGDNLTVTATEPGTFLITAASQNVTLAAGGSFVYYAADGFYGQDSFKYTVDDGHGGTSEATVNLTVTAPPKLAEKFLINEIAVNTGRVTFTITTDNGPVDNTVTTGPAHIEIIKNISAATSSAELRSMQVEIANPNGDLSVISMSQLVGLTVDKAGNPLNLSSAIAAGGSLELFEPNVNGLGVWVVYDSKGTIKLSGTYRDNAWHLGADVTQPIAINLSSLTGESFDLFVANGAPLSDLHGIDTTQSWLTGVGALGTAPHALGSVSPYVPPEKLFAWYGGAQLLPALVPDDVLALLAANQQFNASLASGADTVFARVYDTSLKNGVANGLDKVFIDNNDAGDWTYGPKAILSDGYKNIAAKDTTKFVPNPLDPYDNMNPMQGTGKHGDVIATITNEDGQTIAVISGTGTGGAGHDFLYGVNTDDVLLGSSGDDFIYGSGGNDTLLGGSGGDSLSGGAGNDVVFGGTGKDKLSGGDGSDVFMYFNTNESSVALADVIGDFADGVDKIDLSAIDAKLSAAGNQAFFFAGYNTMTVANSVTWFQSDDNTIIQIDNSGNTGADMQLILAGTGLGLTAADFVL